MEADDGGRRGESSLLVSIFELLEIDEQRSEEVSDDDESDEVSANSADRPAD